MEPRFQSNERRTAEILQYLDEADDSAETYDEAVFAVHPGFCTNNEKYTTVEGLDRDDYRDYSLDFWTDIEEDISDDIPVNIVYRNGKKDEASLYIGGEVDEVDRFIPSNHGNGYVSSVPGQRNFAQALNQVADGGEITLHGEINGLCVTQFQDLVEEVERSLDRDIDVVQGNVFPDRPVDRTEGFLHWEDDVPMYVKTLESKSLY